MLKGRNLTLRYSFLQLFVWLCFAPIMGFTSVYLLKKGYSNTMIGMVAASGGITAALLQPFVATYADKEKSISVKWIVTMIAGVMTGAAGMMILFKDVPVIGLVLFGVLIASVQMTVPFLNALGMESINAGAKLNFGVTRGMGSLGYALISFVLGKATDSFGVEMIPFTVFTVGLAMVFAGMRFPFEKPVKSHHAEHHEKEGEGGKSFLFRYHLFPLFLIGMLFAYIGHNFINIYAFQIITLKGGAETEMGIAIGIAAMSELPIMFAFGLLLKKLRSASLLRIGVTVMFLKALATYFVQGMAAFYMIQLLQAFGFAIMIVAQSYYVNEIMREEDKIKGQAYVAMMGTIGAVLASLVGGRVLDLFHTEALMACGAAAAGFGALVVGISTRKGGTV